MPRRVFSLPMASALYFGLALAVLGLSEFSAEMATFWPANAILVYALLGNSARDRAWFLAGAAVASVAANLIAGKPLGIACLYTFANLVEAVTVVGVIGVARMAQWRLLEPRGLVVLVLAALLGATLSATLADFAQSLTFGRAWMSWFASDLLGMLLVLPAMLVYFRGALATAVTERGLTKRLIVYGAVALVAAVVFIRIEQPLAFLCILPVHYAVFRFGARGAVDSVLIIAVIAIAATLADCGPFAAWTHNHVLQIYLLQAFLAALLLAGLPLAALLERQYRIQQQLLEREREARILSERRERDLTVEARRLALASSRDSLTGVATRARILRQLDHKLAFAARRGQSLAAAVVDIDHFKQINDRFGHDIGDLALTSLGLLAQQMFPSPHAVGRLGGEEFLVILCGLDGSAAIELMERFRRQLGAQSRALLPDSMTISAGFAVAGPGTQANGLLKQADQALLAAKRAGRNQTRRAA